MFFSKFKYPVEKRLLVELFAAREAYISGTISNIGLIRSEFNAADAFTKLKPNDVLMQIIRERSINHPIEQYVVSSNLNYRERNGCPQLLATTCIDEYEQHIALWYITMGYQG